VTEIRKLIGALGVEYVDADVTQLAGAEIRRELAEHQLLVFRRQEFDPAAFTRMAEKLGKLETYPFAEPLPDSGYVVPIVKEAAEVHNFGGAWHSDTAYLHKPPAATLLYAVEVPDAAGDTLFADMHQAYDSLSAGFQRCLQQLTGHNTAALVHDAGGAYSAVAGDRGTSPVANPPWADHPIVRRHPDTRRAALYFSLVHTANFVGLTRPESLPLLEQLHAHVTKAENITRLEWQPGTLAIWDNRSVSHYPLNDYTGMRREMHRIILAGEAPEPFTSAGACASKGPP
jgi:taurine dioxygenase